MNNNLKEAVRWLKQAEYDLNAARYSAAGEYYSIACFQAQQATEKSLKAFLIANGRRHIVSHSILTLIREAEEIDHHFNLFKSHGRILDRYYISARYPDALPDGMPYETFEEADSTLALKKAEDVISFVRKALT